MTTKLILSVKSYEVIIAQHIVLPIEFHSVNSERIPFDHISYDGSRVQLKTQQNAVPSWCVNFWASWCCPCSIIRPNHNSSLDRMPFHHGECYWNK